MPRIPALTDARTAHAPAMAPGDTKTIEAIAAAWIDFPVVAV